jgi:uncharacterized cupredoxin-like copper-binding protein
MLTLRRGVLASLVGLALVVSSCGGGGQPPQGDVQVTLKDFAIGLSRGTVPAGPTKLAITNGGATVHEVEVFALPPGADPAALTVKDNVVDTASAGLTAIDEVEDIAPSTFPTLTVTLQPGRYALICNIPGHYGLGMHALLTVR